MSESQKTMKVKELQAILAACDPEGEVSFFLPSWVFDTDIELEAGGSDGGEPGLSYGAEFTIEASLSTEAKDANDPPDRVEIGWADADHAKAYRARIERAREESEQIKNDDADELVHAGAEHVVVDVLVSRTSHEAIRAGLRAVNATDQVRAGQCTHGVLTVATALGMLAEDLGMVETRPGSWEGSNMQTVLSSHGYNA